MHLQAVISHAGVFLCSPERPEGGRSLRAKVYRLLKFKLHSCQVANAAAIFIGIANLGKHADILLFRELIR